MRMSTPARLAVSACTALVALAAAVHPSEAQQGSGNGFLFGAPKASFTVFGGFAQPMASGGVFALATDELTLGRSDFGSGNFGVDIGFSVGRRSEIVLGVGRSSSSARSEYRDWVDNNDLPIEQTTSFQRVPITASVRYFLGDRGRQIGSVAWIPARFTPFVSAGVGMMSFRYEQNGDFVDSQTLGVFSDQLRTTGWKSVLQAGAGAQWSLNQRMNLTGEVRYLHGTGSGDANGGDFYGYKVNLSGVSTLIGLTFRL